MAQEFLFQFFQYSLCRVVLMVTRRQRMDIEEELFQYSLCRVVLMVLGAISGTATVKFHFQYSLCRVVLMVPGTKGCPRRIRMVFQYSLCRVVLMVLAFRYPLLSGWPFFQYSLCRVVLMVRPFRLWVRAARLLSVLALSSRFDGPYLPFSSPVDCSSFSTRSVESF